MPSLVTSLALSEATGGVVSDGAIVTSNEPIEPPATKLPCVSLTWLACTEIV